MRYDELVERVNVFNQSISSRKERDKEAFLQTGVTMVHQLCHDGDFEGAKRKLNEMLIQGLIVKKRTQ